MLEQFIALLTFVTGLTVNTPYVLIQLIFVNEAFTAMVAQQLRSHLVHLDRVLVQHVEAHKALIAISAPKPVR